MKFCLKKKENTSKTYLYSARSKPQQKPTLSANKYNNNNYNKNRNFSATFRHLCRQLFGNLSPNFWLTLPSNGSWTWHCIFWKMNLVLHYNSCQFRLINKTPQCTVSFSNLCFCYKKKKKRKGKKPVWTATYSFIKYSVNIYVFDFSCKTASNLSFQ